MNSPSGPSIRRLRILVVILVFSNLVVGGVSIYFMEKVDDYYTRLIDTTVPALQALRRLNLELPRMQQALHGLAQPKNQGRRSMLLAEEAAARAAAADSLQSLKRTNAEENLFGPWLENLSQIDRQYQQDADQYLSLLKAGRLDEAKIFNSRVLKPHYETYLVSLENFAQITGKENNQLNDQGTVLTRSKQIYLLGLAGWPLIIVIAVFAFAVPVFSLLIFWSKRSRLDEGP